MSTACGHPPRHTRKARRSMLRSEAPSISACVSNRFLILTSPVESPDSYKLIGRIVNHVKRPVPEWVICFVSAGAAEPVRINCPNSPRWSTSKRIASQSFGASCHSSMRRGAEPFSRRLGFSSDMAMFCSFFSGSSIYKILEASCSAVVVLPHHLGPSISTAPFPSSLRFRISSAILFLYFFIRKTSLHRYCL